jgi:hypothetical protein
VLVTVLMAVLVTVGRRVVTVLTAVSCVNIASLYGSSHSHQHNNQP